MSIIQEQKVKVNERVWAIDWNPMGNMMASVGSSKNITIWKYNQQNEGDKKLQIISTISTDHSKTIRTVQFSHDGKKIVVGSFDSTASVWVLDEQSKQFEHLSTLQGHENQIKCVSWSRDDKQIATCSRDKNIWIWDMDPVSYDYVCDAVLQGHTQDVKFVQWMKWEHRTLVSASYDNSIRIWESEDDDYVCRQVLQAHKSIVWAVKFSEDHLKMYSASEDCAVIEWNLEDQKYGIWNIYSGVHCLPIYTLAIFQTNFIITGSADNYICLWETDPKKQIDKQQTKCPKVIAKANHNSDVNCLKLNPKHPNILASCSDDETLRIWKIKK